MLYLHIGECFGFFDEPEECSSEQCVAKVSSIENAEPRVSQFCADDDETELVGLHFKLDFDINFENINFELLFYCEYDQCNNENNINEVVTIFNEEYDKESVLKKFGYKSESGGEEPETTNSSTKSSISSSSQQPTNSVKSTTVTNPNINNTIATTKTNNGLPIKSTNTIIYVALITFMSRFIFLA
jgi:hypothetical protein